MALAVFDKTGKIDGFVELKKGRQQNYEADEH